MRVQRILEIVISLGCVICVISYVLSPSMTSINTIQHPKRIECALGRPPFRPGSQCARFVLQARSELNDMLTAIVFSSKIAKDVGAGLVLDDVFFSNTSTRSLARLLHLHSFLIKSEMEALALNFVHKTFSTREETYGFFRSNAQHTCNVIVAISADSNTFCHGKPCLGTWFGVYNEMQPLFQQIYHPDTLLKQKLDYFRNLTGNCAKKVMWHFDDPSKFDDLQRSHLVFQKIANEFRRMSAIFNTTFTHFFVYQSNCAKNISSIPPLQFKFMSNFFPGAIFIASVNVDVDFYHLTTSDVLVNTGSTLMCHAAFVATSSVAHITTPLADSSKHELFHNAIFTTVSGSIDKANWERFGYLLGKQLCKRR